MLAIYPHYKIFKLESLVMRKSPVLAYNLQRSEVTVYINKQLILIQH